MPVSLLLLRLLVVAYGRRWRRRQGNHRLDLVMTMGRRRCGRGIGIPIALRSGGVMRMMGRWWWRDRGNPIPLLLSMDMGMRTSTAGRATMAALVTSFLASSALMLSGSQDPFAAIKSMTHSKICGLRHFLILSFFK